MVCTSDRKMKRSGRVLLKKLSCQLVWAPNGGIPQREILSAYSNGLAFVIAQSEATIERDEIRLMKTEIMSF